MNYSEKYGELQIIAPGLNPLEQYVEMEVVGTVVLICSQSKEHENIPLGLLSSIIFPPIINKQYVLILKNNQPIFYCAWALFDEAAETRHLTSNTSYIPKEDWLSGDRMWITDWISPYGHSLFISRLLLSTLFCNKCIRSVYHRPNKKGMRVMTFKGSSVGKTEFIHWKKLKSLNININQYGYIRK